MGKVVTLPAKIPLRIKNEVNIPLEAVVRADLNPAMIYACKRVLEDDSLTGEINRLAAEIVKLMNGRDVAVMLPALYACVEIVLSSWLSSDIGRRFSECLTGSSARPKSGASTPSPWRQLRFCLLWLPSKLLPKFLSSDRKRQPAS